MYVTDIHLENFRNYSNATAKFSNSVNVISGCNAQGKTNLLEAVNFLASGRSFRGAGDKELISFDKESATIRALIVSGGRKQTLQARFFRESRREIYINDVKLKKLSELAGRLNTVLFGPDDLNIVKSGAIIRRKLMDQCLSQLRPGYLTALAEFNRLYEHKNRILRDYREKPSLLDLLEDFNLRLAQQSAVLIYYRSAFSDFLGRKAADIHSEFSDGREVLSVKYKTVGDMDHFGKKPEALLPDLLAHQKERYQAELSSGLVLSGAHKDDLEISINGAPARKFASQGQTRTAAVSIKLAERDLHFDDRGEYPTLLLDDVLSELDSTRQSFILGKIMSGQVLITCCDDNIAPIDSSGTLLRVENGEIQCTCT
jgi:DNA replication and repair protein RecF